MADIDSDSSSDSVNEVRALLNVAGIEPTTADLASLGRIFPGLRRKIDAMYEIDTGDEVSAAVFRAEANS